MIEKDELWDEPQDYSYLFELEKEPPEDWGFDVRKLTPKETNLPVTIWLDDTMQYRKYKYETPLVIVSSDCGDFDIDLIVRLIPVTISKNPKILIPDELFQAKNELSAESWNAIFEFVSNNCDLLLAHWNGTIENDLDVFKLIKKSQYTGYTVN